MMGSLTKGVIMKGIPTAKGNYSMLWRALRLELYTKVKGQCPQCHGRTKVPLGPVELPLVACYPCGWPKPIKTEPLSIDVVKEQYDNCFPRA